MGRGIRFVRAALLLYALEALFGVATLGYTPFASLVWAIAWLVPAVVAANGGLLVLAGIGLLHLERSSRDMLPGTESILLRSRFAFLLALAVVLGTVPTWLLVLMDPPGGAQASTVNLALGWGLALLLAALVVPVVDVLRRREVAPFPGGRLTAVGVAAMMVAVTVPIPVAAILVNGGWHPDAFAPPSDSPGLRVSALLGGAEACLLLLAAFTGPAFALAPPEARAGVRRGSIWALSAVALEVVPSAVLQPPRIGPWFVAPFLGLPPLVWGVPAAVLLLLSLRSIVLAYGRVAAGPPVAPSRLPVASRPPWWAPYVLPDSGLRVDTLNAGSSLVAAALVVFLLMVTSFATSYASAFFGFVGAYLGLLVWGLFLLPIVLIVLLGLGLRSMRLAVRQAAAPLRKRLLLARASFYVGVGVVLEAVPMFLVSVTASRYGPSKDLVLAATWWGLGMLLPFLAATVAATARLLVRHEPSPGRARALAALAAAVPLVLAVPLLSIAVTSAWSPPEPSFYSDPPGATLVLTGAGTEAAFAFLLAVFLPAAGLAPPDARPYARFGMAMALAALALACAFILAAALLPTSLLAARLLLVLGLPGLPWVSWGIVPSGLTIASTILLLIVYLKIRSPLPPRASVRSP